jgi:hypothetical protein
MNLTIFMEAMTLLDIRGKEIPVEAWTGREGSRSLRLTDFKTIGVLRW